MSSSVLDDTDAKEEGTAVVREILTLASELPIEEKQFLEAIATICLNLRGLILTATFTEKETVTGWARELHSVPEAIGIHPEFSNQAQQRIDLFRGIIELRIDEELPTLGRVPGDDGSGINLGEDSGIL